MSRSRIERLTLPAHEGIVASMIERYKALRLEGWQTDLVVVTLPPGGRHRLRRDVALVGLAWKD